MLSNASRWSELKLTLYIFAKFGVVSPDRNPPVATNIAQRSSMNSSYGQILPDRLSYLLEQQSVRPACGYPG